MSRRTETRSLSGPLCVIALSCFYLSRCESVLTPVSGSYAQDPACSAITDSGGVYTGWKICVDSVWLTPEHRMQFNVSWSRETLHGSVSNKPHEGGTPGLFIVDDLRNRYDYLESSGTTPAHGMLETERVLLASSFVFGPRRSGASQFVLFDDDHLVAVTGIRLDPDRRIDLPQAEELLAALDRATSIEIEIELDGEQAGIYRLIRDEGKFVGEAEVVSSTGLNERRELLVPMGEVRTFLSALQRAQAIDAGALTEPPHEVSLTIASDENTLRYAALRGRAGRKWVLSMNGKTFALANATPAWALKILSSYLWGGSDIWKEQGSGPQWPGSDQARKLTPEEVELRAAARDGDVDRARALLAAGVDVDARSAYWEETPLGIVVLMGHAALARLLIEAGADVNTRSARGTSAYVASVRDSAEILTDLIEAGADFDVMQPHVRMTPLEAATVRDHGESSRILRLAMSASASDGSKADGEALYAAAASGSVSGLRRLLERGVPINTRAFDGETALVVASRNGHVEATRLLLDAGADVRARQWKGSTALHLAASNAQIEIAQTLIQAGADVNSRGYSRRTPIFGALSPAVVALLLNAGADVNVRDDDGRTALMVAVYQPEGRGYTGSTYQLGAAFDRLETVKRLIQAGSPINAADWGGRTALIFACGEAIEPDSSVIEALLDAGADPDVRDDRGRTALFYAATNFKPLTGLQSGRRGNPETVRFLLERGASVSGEGELPMVAEVRRSMARR